MIVVSVFRYIKGCVNFEVTGGFTERFFNLTAKNNVPVWNIKHGEDKITATAFAGDYKKLRKYVKRVHVRVRHTKAYGLPFTAKRHKSRIGVVLGMLFFISAVFYLSGFIWSVNITGNKNLSTFHIEQALRECGVKQGVRKSRIDVNAAEEAIMAKVNGLAWIAINIQGTAANIEVREQTEKPQMEKSDTPCNIVALKDGQIIKIDVYDGQAVVKKGDTVSKGQMIVSGIIEDKKGNSQIKHANASVIAKTEMVKQFEVPLEITVAKRTGKVHTKRILRFVNAEIPVWFFMGEFQSQQVESAQKQLSFFGSSMPVYFESNAYYQTFEESYTLNKTEAQRLADEMRMRYEKRELSENNIKIVSAKSQSKVAAGKLVSTVTYIVLENIAAEQEFSVENK